MFNDAGVLDMKLAVVVAASLLSTAHLPKAARQ
jgi:hypothetical protein